MDGVKRRGTTAEGRPCGPAGEIEANAMMKKLILAAAVGLTLAASAPATAMTAAELHQIATLRYISSLVIIDTASSRTAASRRAMTSHLPLTPLQLAIASNPQLMASIRANAWSFDLKSVYSAYVGRDGKVVIYLGEPPT
jgi:hypothetical protein